MKKSFKSVFFLVVILCSGIFLVSTNIISTKQSSPINNNNYVLNSSVLGDVEGSISLTFDPYGITFLSGAIWSASSGESKPLLRSLDSPPMEPIYMHLYSTPHLVMEPLRSITPMALLF